MPIFPVCLGFGSRSAFKGVFKVIFVIRLRPGFSFFVNYDFPVLEGLKIGIGEILVMAGIKWSVPVFIVELFPLSFQINIIGLLRCIPGCPGLGYETLPTKGSLIPDNLVGGANGPPTCIAKSCSWRLAITKEKQAAFVVAVPKIADRTHGCVL